MANDLFYFKQFAICQSQCGMKVGTDGTLLGAWAAGGSRILDVGTGTGLIALMMAQRFPQAKVMGIDIDAQAVVQAQQNMTASPFADRVEAVLADVRQFAPTGSRFDAIVANPPYFDNSLQCPDSQRTMARHTTSLNYRELAVAAWQLLDDEGLFSVIVPMDGHGRMESEAVLAGFSLIRECAVKTTTRKPAKRCMMAFAKHPAACLVRCEEVLQNPDGGRSHWYDELTKDFYLR